MFESSAVVVSWICRPVRAQVGRLATQVVVVQFLDFCLNGPQQRNNNVK
jgi:hypothetical protein